VCDALYSGLVFVNLDFMFLCILVFVFSGVSPTFSAQYINIMNVPWIRSVYAIY
jgi:hypothetical protein